MAVGRISGPLLKANLLREGVDLAFETDLLYLDVNNLRIGVNTATPQYPLDVNGTVRTTSLEVDSEVDIGNFNIGGNTISSDQSTITFAPSGGNPTIYHARLQVDDLEFRDNEISTTSLNTPLEFRPNGSGSVDVYSNANVYGNLDVTGNIDVDGNVTIGGNITIGDSATDTISIIAAITSDIKPETSNTYDLGTALLRWNTLYSNNLVSDSVDVGAIQVDSININDNVISATTTNSDIVLSPNGAGSVKIGNFSIKNNAITNVSSGAITTIDHTGDGYFKISGTNGFVPPVGTISQRPSYAVIGMTRYNTDNLVLEVWDGTQWASPAGSTGAVSETGALDIAISSALVFG